MSISAFEEALMAVRQNRQVETRMVAEYMLQEYGQYTTMTGVPLGQVDATLQAKVGYQKALGLSRPYRPEVDAIAILPSYLVLVEAKVWNVVNGLSKLPLYKSLVATTPELLQYLPRQIIMELVVGWTNGNLEVMAREAGVRIKLYTPDWLKQVVQDMHNYWTKEYRDARAQKLAARQQYGLD